MDLKLANSIVNCKGNVLANLIVKAIANAKDSGITNSIAYSIVVSKANASHSKLHVQLMVKQIT